MKLSIKIEEKNIPYLILFLFVISSILYLNLDGVPLTHPGNIKAADPFYHALAAESILDTKQWNYYDLYVSLGVEKASSVQPPLYYLNTAILTTFSGVPVWVTIYLLICLSAAFIILLVYLITIELFENKKIAIIASVASALPLPVSVWLYGLYIGLWLQVPSNMLMLTFFWLFIRYLKKGVSVNLFFMSLCITGVMLIHPQDLSILFLPSLFIAWKIFTDYLKKKNTKEFLKKSLIFSAIPLILLIVLLPKFLFVWTTHGNQQFLPGFYGFRENFFTRNYAGGLVFPDILFIPYLILLAFIAGLVQILINSKKYMVLISTLVYYFFITYISAFIFKDPYYFVRIRTMTPFVILPIIAYGVYFFIIKPLKKFNLQEYISVLVIALIFIGFGITQYNALVPKLQYEHISLDEWKAYEWIQKNTVKTDRVLFFGAVSQQEFLYTKRMVAFFEMDEYQRIYSDYIKTGEAPLVYKGTYGGDTLRSVHKVEESYWSYVTYPEPEPVLNLLDFNYVVFQNVGQQITQANQVFANEFVNKYGFSLVYNKNGYVILKNGNR